MIVPLVAFLKRAPFKIISFKVLVLFLPFIFHSCKKESPLEASEAIAIDAGIEGDAATAASPNVILILGDDVGYEIPTVNGGESYSTPNIDQLANDGLSFTQCYASSNCSPSRFMLLSGKYNFRNYTQWGIMDRSNRTLGNMFSNAGYKTCYVGKWQLDGGDTSITGFGFNSYSVWLPYALNPEESGGSRYKNPPVYEAGKFLPADSTNGKYSVDIFTKYALNFISKNSKKRFFLYYSMPLCHKPFGPTPDDPEFVTWDYGSINGDRRFFPNMVKYMDKQVKILRDSVAALGLGNTVFIFLGDNGTPKDIVSNFKGGIVAGDKGQTTTYGTHVPLIVTWPRHIRAGRITSQLVDLTDFMPTLSDLTSSAIPADIGIIDGKSFYPVISGSNFSSRDYVFNHFQPFLDGNSKATRYVQDSVYKQYEGGYFFNMSSDINEQSPIKRSQMTAAEKAKQTYFQQILGLMHN